ILIERVRTRRVSHRDRAVAPTANGEQPFPRRRLRPRADGPQRSTAAAVARILQLHDNPVRVAEVKLGSSRAITANIRSPHAHPHAHWTSAQSSSAGIAGEIALRDSALAENARHPLDIEIVDAQAQVIDV